MDVEKANALRAQFEPELVGKLPRVTCGQCANAQGKVCDKHKKDKCRECGSWITTAHMHLDYVGHADVTSRLIEVDPEWNWEPAAVDENGLPRFDLDGRGNPVGLWIKLTVCGVTRLGYGSCPGNQGDAVKVLIGDALRNAAMRFGVALDLWAKGDRADPTAENAVERPTNATRGRRSTQQGSGQQNGAQQGPPRNKDGSISRSQMSDEELAAAGAMTRQQVKDHNKLAKDVQGGEGKAERAGGTAPDDPFYTAPAEPDGKLAQALEDELKKVGDAGALNAVSQKITVAKTQGKLSDEWQERLRELYTQTAAGLHALAGDAT